jgi:hypothetical protein
MKPLSEQLQAELQRAHDAYVTAAAAFRSIMSEVPSGLPHPDGALRIANAAAEQKFALGEYLKALKAYSDYSIGKSGGRWISDRE